MQNVCTSSPAIQKQINIALKNYKAVWKSDEKVFEELCFCLLTPQSSARKAETTINLLKKNKLLEKGNAKEKEPFIKVRFYITKAKRLEKIQEKFPKNKIKKILIKNEILTNPIITREFLVKNVNGFGYKEASHFLRNIGFYDEVAILDRHILKNLVRYEIIKEIPKTLNKKSYLEIEDKMKQYCKKCKINFAELDLIFWSNETGEVFK
ncbi:MAG: N-glycosylase/DNA lyase [archaeon]|jgi:N-glycosylase/DNA lyase